MSEDAVFADLGLADAPDDPNDIPDGVFKAVVHEIKMFEHSQKKEGENKFCIITWRIVQDEPIVIDGKKWVVKDATVDVWQSANKTDSSKKKSFLKKAFLDIGVPKEDVDAGRINFKALVGTPALITVKNKNGFTNVTKVVLADDKGWTPVNQGQTTGGATTSASAQSAPGNLDF
jgi:hypothetical protein